MSTLNALLTHAGGESFAAPRARSTGSTFTLLRYRVQVDFKSLQFVLAAGNQHKVIAALRKVRCQRFTYSEDAPVIKTVSLPIGGTPCDRTKNQFTGN